MDTANKQDGQELNEQELAQVSGAADFRRNYTECPNCKSSECTKEYKIDILFKPYYECTCTHCGRHYDRAV